MSMDRHEPFEELISASLHGDLTADERSRLDAHLDTCDRCRGTLAAFSDQRRIVAGLRHVAPPRDLGARVRTGIEGGSRAGLPWWRRPPAIVAGVGGGLAVVAGALLAIVLLNGGPDEPNVGQATPTPSALIAPSSTPQPTLPPVATPGPSVPPSIEATPSETPIPAAPEPDVFLGLTGPVESPALAILDGTTREPVIGIADTPIGPPIAAELSPDGQWLAYIAEGDGRGVNEVVATRIGDTEAEFDAPAEVGSTVVLGESVAGSPFLDRLSWSADSRYLGFTLADPEDGTTEAWVFPVELGEARPVTDVGNAYAGSWVVGASNEPLLWVSVAGDVPESFLMGMGNDPGDLTPTDPADSSFPSATGVFQPLVSPNGAFVIYWDGRMQQSGSEWLFSESGQPWLANNGHDGAGGYEFTDGRELFGDLTVGREGFSAAAIAWSLDSNAYAVWDAAWTGTPQSPTGDYPDQRRVYLGRAAEAEGITRDHALDIGDIPADARVVDVKVSPTGRHLVVTAARPRAGVLDPPSADLILVTRNTGSVDDETLILGSADDGWFGPGAFGAPSGAGDR